MGEAQTLTFNMQYIFSQKLKVNMFCLCVVEDYGYF